MFPVKQQKQQPNDDDDDSSVVSSTTALYQQQQPTLTKQEDDAADRFIATLMNDIRLKRNTLALNNPNVTVSTMAFRCVSHVYGYGYQFTVSGCENPAAFSQAIEKNYKTRCYPVYDAITLTEQRNQARRFFIQMKEIVKPKTRVRSIASLFQTALIVTIRIVAIALFITVLSCLIGNALFCQQQQPHETCRFQKGMAVLNALRAYAENAIAYWTSEGDGKRLQNSSELFWNLYQNTSLACYFGASWY